MRDNSRTMRYDRRSIVAGLSVLGALGLAPGAAMAAGGFVSRRISVTVRGSGPDVVMIPGLGASPDIWDGAIAAVPGYRYHLVQVKGFAGTAPDGNASGPVVEPVAAEIARYIGAMGLGRPAVVGHSMGGTLALLLGARHQAAGRLMVVDMLPEGAGMVGGTASGMGALAGQLGGYFTGTAGGRAMLRNLMGMFGAEGANNDPDTIADALQDLARIDLTAELPRIDVSMTVLYAVPADRGQRAAITRTFETAYAGARTATLRAVGPSGHVIMYDQPQRFAAEMRAFLRM